MMVGKQTGEAESGRSNPHPTPNPVPDGREPALESHMGTQGATESW